MKLKKARTCSGCKAYDPSHFCWLKFDQKNIPKEQGGMHVTRWRYGDYYTIYKMPDGPCSKPTTVKEFNRLMIDNSIKKEG